MVPVRLAAASACVVNKKPSFADEVIMVLVYGEVVDGFLAWERGDRNHPAPSAQDGLQQIAHT